MNKIMNNKLFLFLLLPFILLVIGCDRVVDESQDDEMARFNAWISVHNYTNYKTPSGLYYINMQEGIGASPVDSSYLLFSYVFRDIDDIVYETTYKDIAILYDIYGLYKTTTHYAPVYKQFFSEVSSPNGFIEGLGMMKEGGKARLIMPSSLGYGIIGSSSIPPFTPLIYDIELKKVVTNPKAYEQSLIDNYRIDSTGFNSILDSIYIKRISAGTRTCIIAKDSVVKVNYVGRFLEDGYIFDTNIKQTAIDSNIYVNTKQYTPLEFTVGSFTSGTSPIKGFHLAVKNMIEGEKATFIMPSKSAYGVRTSNQIYPYTPLVFEITIVSVGPKGSETPR